MSEPRSNTENRKEVQNHPRQSTARSTPRRLRNEDYRPREFLSEAEVERLISAALKEGHRRRQNQSQGRHGGVHSLRNATMILLCFKNALRTGELVRLRWDDIDWQTGTLHCRRLKNGIDSVHPLGTRELKFLKRLKKEQEPSRYMFLSERGSPITTSSFLKLIRRLGEAAGFDFPLHGHMLRHSAGHVLISKGVSIRALGLFMGHRQIPKHNEVRPTKPESFQRFLARLGE
jgi:type 1 fimbriae regulatory protein FimE